MLLQQLKWRTNRRYLTVPTVVHLMRRFRIRENPSGHSRMASFALTAVLLAGGLSPQNSVQAQVVQAPTGIEETATLQGIVRDASNRPVAGATVCLLAKGEQALTAQTDSAGAYRFSAVRHGAYTLRAEMPGYGETTSNPFDLAQKESRTIDLILEPRNQSGVQRPLPVQPEFFDEPHFTVAGVTDTTNLGGHGSDTIARNREALARATASLSKQAAASSPGDPSNAATEKPLRAAVRSEPASFDANHRLGKLLVAEGNPSGALDYLEQAARIQPNDYDNAYELALAYAATGDYERARTKVRALLTAPDESHHNDSAPHHLLGDLDERLGDPLEAVREYQRAAELNPSEKNIFDWGTELLTHRAPEPAIQVFTKGNRLFPRSVRMLEGLGASWYALGSYDHAAEWLCKASDLNPEDSNPYLFMGTMQAAEPARSEAVAERLERFAQLQPENALANYYYAVNLWHRRQSSDDTSTSEHVKALLEKAVHLDPKLGVAYLQLGILYSEQKDLARAISAYQRANEATPGLEQAHYRLAQAYRHAGELSKAQAEMRVYEQISKERQAEVERQRHDVQQFVYQLQGRTAPPQ